MLFGNPIRKAVMEVIDAKIAEKEVEYKAGVENIMVEVEEQLKKIHEGVKEKKAALKKKLVDDILSKVL